VTHVASVRVGSRDLAPWVDAYRKGSVRARRGGYVERSDGSIFIAYEAVDPVDVKVVASDFAARP